MTARSNPPTVTELHLERWVPGGLCLAHSGGCTWFVSYGLPGERVNARVKRRARGVIFADVVEVLEPSPERVTAPCPHFGPGLCGGCDVQHVSLEEQHRMKREIIRDCLERLGPSTVADRVDATQVLPGSARGLAWRTRLSGERTARGIGLHRARSHEVESVGDCLIAAPGLVDTVLSAVADGASFRAALGDDSAVAVDSGQNSGSTFVHETVTTSLRAWRWRLPVRAFWQVHVGAAQYLGDLVSELLGDTLHEKWWDLYAGAGMFTAFLLDGGASTVDMVESDGDAIRAARRTFHDAPAVTIHHSPVAPWLEGRAEAPDGVLLDPPRRGCDPGIIAGIVQRRPSRVVYVSCDPATFARDSAHLADAGYRLSRVVPLDAFPMTHHVETVALFVASDQIS